MVTNVILFRYRCKYMQWFWVEVLGRQNSIATPTIVKAHKKSACSVYKIVND